ncbi:glycerate kinase [Hyunsoonleella jejuensis]|uniref:Glycerate kinase n=1 Tax=Hyunsoonleella jejuensis TaxID=419940 RepID=A0A1H9BXW8_9FLAO|nr:glycerate kinase [Hyunsoonleella jejuensis]SEP93433.1 glycerate kinase [Hyunsoonleella jejuensis]
MKIVVAPDKFKKSLTGLQFCDSVEASILKVLPNCEILKLPLADGGDGTIEIVNYYLKGTVITVTVNSPFFKKIKATYLYAEVEQTAFLEMAEASGVKLLRPKDFDCKNATTLGTGEMILDAINRGAKKIILGIGGSATNDCGMGMATALGYRFLDADNRIVKPIGANLSKVSTIDTSQMHPKLKEVKFNIACDVSNPLYGKNGSAYVYAKQKGATTDDIVLLDKGLQDFAKVIEAIFGINPQQVEGAGAAGGMGIASKVFLKGTLQRGVNLVKDLAQFDKKLIDTDWIITGEGNLDAQTFSGKTIQGVLASAKAKKIKVAAFCGGVDLNKEEIKELGLVYVDAVLNYTNNTEDAMKNSLGYLKIIAKNFAKNLI